MREKHSDANRLFFRFLGDVGGSEPEGGATQDVLEGSNQEVRASQEPEEKGQVETDYKTFHTQADYDRAIQKALKSREDNLRKEIKNQLEKEQSMTAEQIAQEKLQSSQKELEKAQREFARERNALSAERMFMKAGIPEKSYKSILDAVVTDDAEKSEDAVKTIIAGLKAAAKEMANEELKRQIGSVGVPKQSPVPESKEDAGVSFARELGKEAHRMMYPDTN